MALSADISEMFLQIELQEKDRQYHRFLWRDFDTRDPDVYTFTRLLHHFAPSTSFRPMQRHALDFPEAAITVNDSVYVDNVLDPCETTQSAQQLRRQLLELLALAGFKLRKWSSNELMIIKDIPLEDRLCTLEISKDERPKTKTLGVIWEAKSDDNSQARADGYRPFKSSGTEYPKGHSRGQNHILDRFRECVLLGPQSKSRVQVIR